MLQADPALQRLPAPGLRGTWARAYALLTRLVSQIGWDELLKSRSSVFVMEEEYRMQKAQGDIQQVTNGNYTDQDGDVGNAVIHEDGMVASRSLNSADTTLGADDDASIRGVVSASSPPTHPADDSLDVSGPDIPTIRISTESDRERDDTKKDDVVAETETIPVNGDANPNAVNQNLDTLEKPEQSAAREGDSSEQPSNSNPASETFSFSNKRLCERWLDNLFMVLYEASLLFNSVRTSLIW
jgi:hypothetical protein